MTKYNRDSALTGGLCGCRSVAECTHESMFPELTSLHNLIDDFAGSMKQKLTQKLMEGFAGWDNPTDFPIEKIKERLLAHVERGDPIDIACFAAFWWNMEQEQPDE